MFKLENIISILMNKNDDIFNPGLSKILCPEFYKCAFGK